MVQRNVDIISYLNANDREVLFPDGIIPDSDLGQAEAVFSVFTMEAPEDATQVERAFLGPDAAVLPDSIQVRVAEEIESDETSTGAVIGPGQDGITTFNPDGLVQKSQLASVPRPVPEFQSRGPLSLGAAPSLFDLASIQSPDPGTTFLSAPDDPAFQWTNALSVSFWMRPAALSNQIPLVGKGVNTSGEEGWSIGMDFSTGTSGRFWAETEQVSGGMGSSSAYARWSAINNQFVTGTWRHHLFVFDFTSGVPPTLTQYTDGVMIGAPTLTGVFDPTRTNNAQPFRVMGGSGFYSGSSYTIDVNMIDMALYVDKVLTLADAQTLYNAGTPVPPLNATTSQPPDIYYTLRNLATGLTDLIGNAPSLVNTGCLPTTLFP